MKDTARQGWVPNRIGQHSVELVKHMVIELEIAAPSESYSLARAGYQAGLADDLLRIVKHMVIKLAVAPPSERYSRAGLGTRQDWLEFY